MFENREQQTKSRGRCTLDYSRILRKNKHGAQAGKECTFDKMSTQKETRIKDYD